MIIVMVIKEKLHRKNVYTISVYIYIYIYDLLKKAVSGKKIRLVYFLGIMVFVIIKNITKKQQQTQLISRRDVLNKHCIYILQQPKPHGEIKLLFLILISCMHNRKQMDKICFIQKKAYLFIPRQKMIIGNYSLYFI